MSIHLLGGQYHRLYKLLTGLSRQEALHLRGGDLADISARSAARPVPAALWPGMAICLSVRHCERSAAICLSVRHRERNAARVKRESKRPSPLPLPQGEGKRLPRPSRGLQAKVNPAAGGAPH